MDKSYEGNIQRGRVGIILPERNAFDFVERPNPSDGVQDFKKNYAESGRSKLQRTLLALKKQNAKNTFFNKHFTTLKADY